MSVENTLAGILPLEMTMDQTAQLLEESRWAPDLDWEYVHSLAGHFQVYQIPEEVEIITEGASSPFLGIVVAGRLVVEKQGGSGERTRLSSIGVGKAIGEIGLIDKFPPSASVVTAEESKLLVLSTARFEGLCKQRPALANILLLKISRTLGARLRQTSGRLVDFLADGEN